MSDRERFLRGLFTNDVLVDGCRIQYRVIWADEQLGGDAPVSGPRKYHYRSVEDALGYCQKAGFHVFVSPVSRTPGSSGAGGDHATLVRTRCLWADIDDKDRDGQRPTLSTALAVCERRGLVPSWVIRSGVGEERGHLYWLLDEAVPLQPDRSQVDAALVGLAQLLGGDKAVARSTAMMRLPGTFNYKPGYGPDFPECRFLDQGDDTRRYSLDEVLGVVGAEPPIEDSRRGPRKRKLTTQVRGRSEAAPEPVIEKHRLASLLESCAFVRHARDQSATLQEPLWQALLQVLATCGAEGRVLAHEWSRPHEGYSVEQTDRRLDYAISQHYEAPGCRKIVELGFSCPHLASREKRCQVLGVTSPSGLVQREEAGDVSGYVDEQGTWTWGKNGPRRNANFWVEFQRDIRQGGERFVEGVIHLGAMVQPFTWEGAVLTDGRSLSNRLARELGVRFVADRRSLLTALAVWQARSSPVEVILSSDFGFSDDGLTFTDTVAPLPPGAARFSPPQGTAASRLGLGVSEAGEVREVIGTLMSAWCRLVAEPRFVGAMLGIVAWAVVAPVIEAQKPGTPALLAWLSGRTGVGKTSHARIAQCFFGNFSTGDALVNFGSTPLAIEEAGHWFRGALMIVDDVKADTARGDDKAIFESVVQRLWDRSSRRRLGTSSRPLETFPFRGTALFTGEDVALRGAAALARLLLVPVPDPVCDLSALRLVQDLLPHLSGATRAFVQWLMERPGWVNEVGDDRARLIERGMASLGSDANRARVAGSVASVVAGYDLLEGWLREIQLDPPITRDDVWCWLAALSAGHLRTSSERTPGPWFLDRLRSLLAGRRVTLEPDDHGPQLVGWFSDDRRIVYIIKDLAHEQVRRHLAGADEVIPNADSIAADLDRMGLIAEKYEDRRTKRPTVPGTGQKVTAWVLHAHALSGGEVEE
ncbi:MAG: hypothetical protein ABIO70_28400 [Pseudomonadota bacterium]